MTLSKKETKALQKEIETFFEEGKDEDFDNFTSFLQEADYDSKHPEQKIGDHTFKFVYYDEPYSPDAEVNDGSPVHWVFELDGHLFAVEGQYSSWDFAEVDEEWVPVEKATKVVEYYKKAA